MLRSILSLRAESDDALSARRSVSPTRSSSPSIHGIIGRMSHLLLACAGRVQQFAWTSRNLPPELRLYGDRSVQDGWSSLFASLASAPAWLEETYGFTENAAIQRAAILTELIAARRDAERLSATRNRGTGRPKDYEVARSQCRCLSTCAVDSGLPGGHRAKPVKL